MAYDGITLYHLIEEFKPLLIGGRIRKIYQPEIDEIRLLVNLGNQKHHVLLSANASNPRAYMTEKIKKSQCPTQFLYGFEEIHSQWHDCEHYPARN